MRGKKMYNERINLNVIITDVKSDLVIKKMNLDGKGRGTFKVKTYINFINKRVPYDLLFGYYIKTLSGEKQGWKRMIAHAVVPKMGTKRISANHEGEFVIEDMGFMESGHYVLECFMCERPDLEDTEEDEFDF